MADVSIKCPHCGKEVNDTVTTVLVEALQQTIEAQIIESVVRKVVEKELSKGK